MKRTLRLFMLLCSVFAAADIMAQTAVHNVRPGDTFESVASKYGINVNALMSANPYIPKCHVGAQLVIPTVYQSDASQEHQAQTATSQQPKKNIQQATAEYIAQTKINTTDPYNLLYNGVSLLKAGKYSKAKKTFTKALKVKDIREAYYYRGLCNYKTSKWKSAYKDFSIAKRSNKLNAQMKADASDLYTYTYNKYKEKVERRREAWAEIGKAVGTTLLAVGTVAAGVASETMAASSGYGSGYGSAASIYSQSVNSHPASGIASMSSSQFNNYLNTQLTDLLYISAAQMQQRNYNEYMQFTNGGQTMTYDQWMNIKAQSMMATQPQPVSSYSTDIGSSTTTDYEQRKQDILNTVAGEACLSCKGTGKCPTCNGTKIASGFGNTYKCTVCNDNGDCPVCHGTKVTSWNR